MNRSDLPRWLEWAREIQSLSQTGLAFSQTDFDTQRYTRLAEIAAEIMESHTGRDKKAWVDDFMAQPGYATPKVDVRGAVVKDGKILLVQERVDNRWAMPGGWADVGDGPSDMVVREVREESGLDVMPQKVVGVYDANRDGEPLAFFHAYKIVFLCEILGGEPTPSDETLAVDFFPFHDLPPLSTNRTNTRHLMDVSAHLRDPSCLAVFD